MKKITVILFVLALLAVGCSCARENRFGVFELERRLCEINKTYAFDAEGMFRKEGVYHIFYPAGKGTLLLKVREDNRRRIEYLSLTAADADEDTSNGFSALACALTDVILPEDARADARFLLRLEDPATFFVDETLTAEYGRHKVVFFKSTKGISLMLRYEPLPAT